MGTLPQNLDKYCKFGNFREGFSFLSFRVNKIPTKQRNHSFVYCYSKSCSSREFLTSQIYLLMHFTKIKFSQKFPDLQYQTVKNIINYGPLREKTCI